jgi:hypothetical protein
MKTSTVIIALVLAAGTYSAQTKQTRDVSGFHSLKVSSAIKVVLTMGDKESVVVEAKDDVLSKIKSEVKGGVLLLHCEGEIKNGSEMTAYVTAKQIKDLDVSGASQLKLTNTLEGDKLEVEASGAASLNLDLKVKTLDADIDGATMLKVTGVATALKVEVEGASEFKGSDLKSEEVEIEASGASHASVIANKNIKIHATGASNVTYKGQPEVKELNTSGAATVKKG